MIKVTNICDYCGNDITTGEHSTTYRRGTGPEMVVKDVCESCTKEMLGMLSFLGIDLYDCFVCDKRKDKE